MSQIKIIVVKVRYTRGQQDPCELEALPVEPRYFWAPFINKDYR